MPQWLKSAVRLLAGLFIFNLLLNLPRAEPAALFSTLLAPSIDLLVAAAICLAGVRTGDSSRRTVRIAAAVVTVLLMACAVGERFGWAVYMRLFGDSGALPAAASLVLCAATAAAAFAAAYAASGLVAAGFGTLIVQNVFLLLIAASVVAQVLVGVRVFSPSVVPKAIKAVSALFG